MGIRNDTFSLQLTYTSYVCNKKLYLIKKNKGTQRCYVEETHSGRVARLSAIVGTFHKFSSPGESLSPLGQVKDKTPSKGR